MGAPRRKRHSGLGCDGEGAQGRQGPGGGPEHCHIQERRGHPAWGTRYEGLGGHGGQRGGWGHTKAFGLDSRGSEEPKDPKQTDAVEAVLKVTFKNISPVWPAGQTSGGGERGAFGDLPTLGGQGACSEPLFCWETPLQRRHLAVLGSHSSASSSGGWRGCCPLG